MIRTERGRRSETARVHKEDMVFAPTTRFMKKSIVFPRSSIPKCQSSNYLMFWVKASNVSTLWHPFESYYECFKWLMHDCGVVIVYFQVVRGLWNYLMLLQWFEVFLMQEWNYEGNVVRVCMRVGVREVCMCMWVLRAACVCFRGVWQRARGWEGFRQEVRASRMHFLGLELCVRTRATCSYVCAWEVYGQPREKKKWLGKNTSCLKKKS